MYLMSYLINKLILVHKVYMYVYNILLIQKIIDILGDKTIFI